MAQPRLNRAQFIWQYALDNNIPTDAIRDHGYHLKGKTYFAVPTEDASSEGWQMVTPEEYLDMLHLGMPTDYEPNGPL